MTCLISHTGFSGFSTITASPNCTGPVGTHLGSSLRLGCRCPDCQSLTTQCSVQHNAHSTRMSTRETQAQGHTPSASHVGSIQCCTPRAGGWGAVGDPVCASWHQHALTHSPRPVRAPPLEACTLLHDLCSARPAHATVGCASGEL